MENREGSMMNSKRLHHMEVHSVAGNEVSSILKYYVENRPTIVIGLYKLYGDDIEHVITWFTGFSYMLGMMEDEGMPIDVDEALHGWDGDEPYSLLDDINRWFRDNS